MSNIQKVIVITDLQVPFHDALSLRAVEKYMGDERWDAYVNLGDFLDYFCISRFNEGKPGLVGKHTILEEVKSGEVILQRHTEIVRKNNAKAKFFLLEGNHCHRAVQYTQMFPFFQGFIEAPVVLKLAEKNVTFIKSWSEGQVLTIGKANFIHGNYTNEHHAKKHVLAYEDNIFYGHVHDCNAFNKSALGTGKTKVGQALGCLCEYPKDIDYTKGRAKNWQQAVTTFFFQPSGEFQYYISRIFNHRFVAPNGKLYDGNK